MKARNRVLSLLQLLKDNADRPRTWSIQQAGDEAVVYVYDVIGGLFGGVDAEVMARDLAGVDASTIRVRINSPGGDVFDGRAIATALRQHPAQVVANVDGLAASAATTIAAAADRVDMAAGSFYMIHNAWTLAIGNRNDMLEIAELLEKIDGQIAADYVARTGATDDQVADWMDRETWFTAEEAVENGFADSVDGRTSAKAGAWNLSAYAHAPDIQEGASPDEDFAWHKAQMERRLQIADRLSA